MLLKRFRPMKKEEVYQKIIFKISGALYKLYRLSYLSIYSSSTPQKQFSHQNLRYNLILSKLKRKLVIVM